MKTILVDAIDAFVIEGEGIFKEMHEMLEGYPNRKIILTGANDEQMNRFGLNDMPYEVFTLKHNPQKTDPKYYEQMLQNFGLTKDDVIYFEHDKDAVKADVNRDKYLSLRLNKKDFDTLKSFVTKSLRGEQPVEAGW